jgi:hypothetical protein|tara:strand:+ start:169 stop:390 length:222 start_codon:yes stop_codon:yes gene_type:complete
MKYKVTLDDLRLISIGFIPALVALYIIYYLAYFLWWVPFLVVFPALAYFFGVLLEEKAMIIYYFIKKHLTNRK